MPATQLAHEEEPLLGLYEPAGQGVHVADEVAPVAVLKVPAGHNEQLVLLGVSL